MTKAKKLIEDIKTYGWQTPNLYKRFYELINKDEEAFKFCNLFIDRFEESSTLFDDALSYINKTEFQTLIDVALERLKQNSDNEIAESVITYASFQFPELLHPHLGSIFELLPNESSYFAEYPWRNLCINLIPAFKDKFLSETTSLKDKQKLFSCLLETRDKETIQFIYDYVISNDIFQRADTKALEDRKQYLIYWIESAGFTFAMIM